MAGAGPAKNTEAQHPPDLMGRPPAAGRQSTKSEYRNITQLSTYRGQHIA